MKLNDRVRLALENGWEGHIVKMTETTVTILWDTKTIVQDRPCEGEFTLEGAALALEVFDDNSRNLTFKKGDYVVIKKGTTIRTIGQEPKQVGRTYKVRVDHTLSCIVESTMRQREGSNEPYFIHTVKSEPRVCWPGSGGYWTEANMHNVELAK